MIGFVSYAGRGKNIRRRIRVGVSSIDEDIDPSGGTLWGDTPYTNQFSTYLGCFIQDYR